MANNHSEEYFKQQLEESEKSKTLYQDTINAMQTEERFVNFFKGYNAQSVEGFIKHYATMKAIWYKHAEPNYRYTISKKSKWRDECVELLKMIYEKKLFNLKCRWIAGEMDLEGIEISSDFNKISHTPELCSFLEPITYEEFHCLINFMECQKTKAAEEINKEDENNERVAEDCFQAFGYYHWHKAHYIESCENMITEWFRFYDKRFNTQSLLDLPLIRMEMELDLHDIWTEEVAYPALNDLQKKNHLHITRKMRIEFRDDPEKGKAFEAKKKIIWGEMEKTKIKFNFYHAHGELLNKVVDELETKEMRNNFNAYTLWHRRKSNNEQIEMDIIHLNDVKEWVSIESNDDFRDGVKKAYQDYSDKKVLQTLPFVFEEYRSSIEKNKPFEWKTKERDDYGANDDRKKRLKEALKFKGEPESFDFLKKDNLPKS